MKSKREENQIYNYNYLLNSDYIYDDEFSREDLSKKIRNCYIYYIYIVNRKNLRKN